MLPVFCFFLSQLIINGAKIKLRNSPVNNAPPDLKVIYLKILRNDRFSVKIK